MELSLGLAFPTALRFSFALTCALTGVTIATNVHAQTPASPTARAQSALTRLSEGISGGGGIV